MPRGRAVLKTNEIDESELEHGFHVENPNPTDLTEPTYTVAGPVKVTKRDGTVEVQAPYAPAEYDKIVKRPRSHTSG